MDNLILSFNVVLPIFLCILLGYFLRRIRMVDTPSLNVMNKLCFKVFLPIYLFNNIATTNLAAAFNGKLLATAYLGVTAQFILLMILIPRLEKENPRRRRDHKRRKFRQQEKPEPLNDHHNHKRHHDPDQAANVCFFHREPPLPNSYRCFFCRYYNTREPYLQENGRK